MHVDAVERRLISLPALSRQGKRINGLHRLLDCPKIWARAYEAIARNSGALTPGIDPRNTLDGFSLDRLDWIIRRVKEEATASSLFAGTTSPRRTGNYALWAFPTLTTSSCRRP